MSAARTLGTLLQGVCTVLAVMIATTDDAYAYVDPGTGAMIVQIVAAVVAGALFYFRTLRDKIASWFSRLTSRDPAGKDGKE